MNKKCDGCCHFKKETMELYKLNLPNGIVNNIIGIALPWVKKMNVRIVGHGNYDNKQLRISWILKVV